MYKEFLKSGGRFTTTKGVLTVEQLLNLNATQGNIDFLDKLAVDLQDQYDSSKGKSFVKKRTSKDKSIKLALDIVLDILNDMVETFETISQKASNKVKLQELLTIKAERQKEAQKELSDKELEKQIKELS